MLWRGILVIAAMLSLSGCLRTTVLQFSTGGELSENEAAWLRRFEEQHPTIRIRPVKLPAFSMSQHDSYVTYLSSGGESVDVFAIDVIWLAEFAESGFIAALDPYFTKEERDIYLPSLLEAGIYRGQLYGIPGVADIGLLYRNLRLLREKKLPKERSVRMAEILRGGVGHFVFQAAFSESLMCNLLEFFDAAVELSSDLRESLRQERTAWLEALARMKQAVAATRNTVLRMAEPESGELFLQKKAIYLRNWPYFLALLRQRNWRYGEDFDVVPLPERATIGGWYLVANASSPYKKEAAQFIRFMAGEEVQRTNLTQHYEKGKSPGLPSVRSLYQSAELRARFPELEVAERALKNARARFISPNYYEHSRIVLREVYAFLQNRQSAEKALARIEKQLAAAAGI
ncbi:MAG: extracellular solute-binding protein [Turneriella sp.]|nr:extracellular solute-binding protein [Turneriella sp.]